MMKPRRLTAGDAIGLIAPCGAVGVSAVLDADAQTLQIVENVVEA